MYLTFVDIQKEFQEDPANFGYLDDSKFLLKIHTFHRFNNGIIP